MVTLQVRGAPFDILGGGALFFFEKNNLALTYPEKNNLALISLKINNLASTREIKNIALINKIKIAYIFHNIRLNFCRATRAYSILDIF